MIDIDQYSAKDDGDIMKLVPQTCSNVTKWRSGKKDNFHTTTTTFIMNFFMYKEYRVREVRNICHAGPCSYLYPPFLSIYGNDRILVEETMKSVMEAACSFETDRITVVDKSGEVSTVEDFNLSTDYTEESDSEYSDSGLALEVGDMARAHWIQLHKLNKQASVIQSTFIHMLESYKHIRPIWQFGKRIDDTNSDWKLKLYDDFYFRHHCASVQSAITTIMENMDDRECLRKLVNEIGAHHYFYDACEQHLDLFVDAMITTMKKTLGGPIKMDTGSEQSWQLLLNDVKNFMGEGIAIQRNIYLRQCMTSSEILDIRSKWERIVEYGLQDAGKIMCTKAIQSYGRLLESHNMRPVIPFRVTTDILSRFAEQTMKAFDVTLKEFSETTGFCELPEKVKDFVVKYMVLEMCPTFARKAMMEGMFTMLSRVIGDQDLNESVLRIWSKLYRVLEQAIIVNIVEHRNAE
ncbi:hypothetical protein RB195_013370 [Necator americanus]|uniref:Globin domain-containing protein n=1 Tax=Necator americanus TaxID=51031 RepID=A0ABR1DV72_NECAM